MITHENLQHWKNVAESLAKEIAEFENQQAAPVDDWPMTIWDLPKHNGFCTLHIGSVRHYDAGGEIDESDFATEKDAKSALAFAQLSRLIRYVNKGLEPNFSDSKLKYYIKIDPSSSKMWVEWTYHQPPYPACLCFSNSENAQKSIETWRQLWLDYFQVDEQEGS